MVNGRFSGHAALIGAGDLQGEADAVVERAAVLVGALVGQRRQEFVREIAVRGVDFQPAVTGRLRPDRGSAEGVDDPGNFVAAQLVRHALVGRVEGQRARPHRQPAAHRIGHLRVAFPRALGARLAARVSELDGRDRARGRR